MLSLTLQDSVAVSLTVRHVFSSPHVTQLSVPCSTELCGFEADNSKRDQVLDKWTNLGYEIAAAVIAMIILVLAVAALSIKVCTRRCGKIRITDKIPNVTDESSSVSFNNQRPCLFHRLLCSHLITNDVHERPLTKQFRSQRSQICPKPFHSG